MKSSLLVLLHRLSFFFFLSTPVRLSSTCPLLCYSLQDVSCNDISALPRQLGRLRALRELNVRRNALCVLPEGEPVIPNEHHSAYAETKYWI